MILSEDDTFLVDDGWLALESPQLQDPTIALNEVLSRQEREMIESVLREPGAASPGQAVQQKN